MVCPVDNFDTVDPSLHELHTIRAPGTAIGVVAPLDHKVRVVVACVAMANVAFIAVSCEGDPIAHPRPVTDGLCIHERINVTRVIDQMEPRERSTASHVDERVGLSAEQQEPVLVDGRERTYAPRKVAIEPHALHGLCVQLKMPIGRIDVEVVLTRNGIKLPSLETRRGATLEHAPEGVARGGGGGAEHFSGLIACWQQLAPNLEYGRIRTSTSIADRNTSRQRARIGGMPPTLSPWVAELLTVAHRR